MLSALKAPVDERPEQQVAATKSVQDYIRNGVHNSHYKLLFIIHKAWVNSIAWEMNDQVKHCYPTATLEPLLKLALFDFGLASTFSIWMNPANYCR